MSWTLTPNSYEQRTPEDQQARLIEYMDWIRSGLAGNLRDFPLQKANGDVVPAENIKYNGKPDAYTGDIGETAFGKYLPGSIPPSFL